LIALLAGLLMGYGVNDMMGGHEMDMGMMAVETEAETNTIHIHDDGSEHDHGEMLDISDLDAIPSVRASVIPDPMSGWNVAIQTTNFRFSPENASMGHVDGEGHAHIYVDGKKIGRMYGDWYHLPALGAGEHTIMVTLNGNDHVDWMVNGEQVMAMVSVKE